MTLEDPFYVVKDEVFKALNKTRGLYIKWVEISASAVPPHCPEAEWTSTELKNALRSIEWDLEDLEDTISIVEKNSSKFKIDNKELCERKKFINNTRKEVLMMRGRLTRATGGVEGSPREPLLSGDSAGVCVMTGGSASEPLLAREGSPPQPSTWDEDSTPLIMHWDRPYHPLPSNPPRSHYVNSPLFGREEINTPVRSGGGAHDAHLDALSASTGKLKNVSLQIGAELDDHSVLIDELNAEMENTGSQLDSTVNKVARVLRLNSDGRQWSIIGLLILLVFILMILLIIL